VGNDPVNGIDPFGEDAWGANVEFKLAWGSGAKISAEFAVDTGTGELRANLTTGVLAGGKVKAEASLFNEPSQKIGNQITAKQVATAEAGLGLKIIAVTLEASIDAEVGGEFTLSSEGITGELVLDLNPTGIAEIGPLSVDSDGRTSATIGGSAGVTVGEETSIDVNISLPDTIKAVKKFFGPVGASRLKKNEK
jgi:hypothetical protein